ncbi:hypothetical protein Q6346_02185 [Isoptericola sp. b490]|uniref:hypothetical protein n=1 Tax=Actinotalea lenta TaxID=3064654 RepID=UPI0027135200|nr:hypothetical protein [Isoptericola sp. b490]MDO8120122.1 hypothetical protein [Isoptericola sp. b490]
MSVATPSGPEHEMNVPSSILRDHGDQPFLPVDVARAVLIADDGLYEALVARHDPDAVHRSGAWRLLRHDAWTPQAVEPAAALRGLLADVQHPLAEAAVAALGEGIDSIEITPPERSDHVGRHAA